jgi:hypothetical protein
VSDADPPSIVQLGPPVTSVPWSSEFVAQTLEPLMVYLPDGATEPRILRPIHADSLRLGWAPPDQPGEVVLRAVVRYDLTPLLVHSTSWRHEEGRLVLTYLVAVEPPDRPNEHLADEPVRRTDLARGDAFGPPPRIGVAEVVEHAFRHLAWLTKDDPVVAETMAGWASMLRGYEPEPFRAFGPSVPSP